MAADRIAQVTLLALVFISPYSSWSFYFFSSRNDFCSNYVIFFSQTGFFYTNDETWQKPGLIIVRPAGACSKG